MDDGTSGLEAPAKRTALYRMFDRDGALLYIGISDRFGRRWSEHAAKQFWWPDVQRQTVDWYDSRSEAADAEAAAICSEQPRFNTVHLKNGRRGPKARAARPEPDITERRLDLWEVFSNPWYGWQHRTEAYAEYVASFDPGTCALAEQWGTEPGEALTRAGFRGHVMLCPIP